MISSVCFSRSPYWFPYWSKFMLDYTANKAWLELIGQFIKPFFYFGNLRFIWSLCWRMKTFLFVRAGVPSWFYNQVNPVARSWVAHSKWIAAENITFWGFWLIRLPVIFNRTQLLIFQWSSKIMEPGWEVLSYPPYAIDLTPTAYNQFLQLFNNCGVKRLVEAFQRIMKRHCTSEALRSFLLDGKKLLRCELGSKFLNLL